MGRKLNLRKTGSTAILAISVAGGGIIIGHIFLLGSGSFLTVFAGLALCGILGWISINHGNRAREDRTRGSVLEIVGKLGLVVQECSPEGKVRIGDVTWSAISYDGVPLRVGEKITVQDMRELKLAVKAKPSAMSLNH
jgi:membrane protein implicated in regulation of membrane protease activity